MPLYPPFSAGSWEQPSSPNFPQLYIVGPSSGFNKGLGSASTFNCQVVFHCIVDGTILIGSSWVPFDTSSYCQSFVLLYIFYHMYFLACSPNIHNINSNFSMFATQFCSVLFKIRRDFVWFGAL
jgi:hypothetical protein